ncbi:pentatricopeptide repeat-containing protein [Carex littledalei]|uniref:Pentatricopeptide repeat-containing protein n=1 Tax=Carex littledalei TaxID=544730 RepID=A0A833S002_9POAL|nr:pentatricopeptide repeat-containing protein [Carex littledalei]
MALFATTRHLLRRHLSTTSPAITDSTIAIVRQLSRKGEVEKINSILSPLLSTSPPPSDATLASIVYLYSCSGMLKEALDAFSTHPTPSTGALNSLLAPLNRHSRNLSRQIPSLFTSLPASKSVAPDQITYGILIKSLCVSGGGAEKALPVLKQMEDKNIPVSAVVYSTIMYSFYKESKPERAEELWKEMCGKGIVPDVSTYNVFDDGLKRGMVPDLGTVKVLVKGLMEEKNNRAAKGVVTRLKHKFPEEFVGNWKQLLKLVGLSEEEETESTESFWDQRFRQVYFEVLTGDVVSGFAGA